MKGCNFRFFIKVKDRFQLKAAPDQGVCPRPFAEPWGSQERGEVSPRASNHPGLLGNKQRFFFENPFPHFRVSRILSGRVTGTILTVLQDASA